MENHGLKDQKMPLSKATKYKQFNVGAYMKERRQQSEMIQGKSKEVRVQSKRLERLDEMVSRALV